MAMNSLRCSSNLLKITCLYLQFRGGPVRDEGTTLEEDHIVKHRTHRYYLITYLTNSSLCFHHPQLKRLFHGLSHECSWKVFLNSLGIPHQHPTETLLTNDMEIVLG
jgi:hypothetical protein